MAAEYDKHQYETYKNYKYQNDGTSRYFGL